MATGYKRKRGKNSWQLEVSAGYGPNGKRKKYTRTVRIEGKNQERQADILLAEFITEVEKGLYIGKTKLTFKEYTERWLKNYAEPELSPNTLYNHKRRLETRILPTLGHLKLTDIKPINLVEFYREQMDSPRLDGKEGTLSPRTVHHMHRLIHEMLETAVQWELIISNPASKVKPPKVPKNQPESYDEQEIKVVLEVLKKEDLKHQVMVLLVLTSGGRRSEIMGLDWQNVDFENNIIYIEEALLYNPENGCYTKPPKNDSSLRQIAMPEAVMSLLKAYKAEQNEHRLSLGDKWQGSTKVFTTWEGKDCYPGWASHWWKRFLERNNLPPLRLHGLRHTAATLLIAEGLPVVNVAKRLGHSRTSTTTDIYAMALKSRDNQAADTMEFIITGKKPKKTKKATGKGKNIDDKLTTQIK